MNRLLIFLLLPLFSVGQTATKPAAKGFTVKGTIKGLKDSTMVFINNPMVENKVIATAYSKNGSFTLVGTVPEPEFYVMSFIGYPDMKDFFLANAPYTITGDAKALSAIKITGGAVQKDYEAFTGKFDPIKNRLNTLANKINATPAGPSRDSMIQVFEAGKLQVLNMVGEYVKLRPESPVSAYVLYATYPINNDLDVVEERYAMLKDNVKEGTYARQIYGEIMKNKVGLEGTMALDFTQNDTANNPVSLSSFRGKYVLVDFWASWCGPCRHENPNVVAAYNAFKDKNFTVLGVSLDQNRQKWLDAIKVDNLTWTHVSDLKFWSNEVAQMYKVQGIPFNFLVDPTGKIVARNLRGEQLHAALAKYIK